MQRVSFRPQIGGIYPDIGRYTPVYTPKGRGYPVKFHWILICTNTMTYSLETMAVGLYGKSWNKEMVATGGLEPPTPALWMLCSNQLSYVAIICCKPYRLILWPLKLLTERIGGAHFRQTERLCQELRGCYAVLVDPDNISYLMWAKSHSVDMTATAMH